MTQEVAYHERALLLRLSKGDREAFDALFYANWDQLFSAAMVITKSPELADDIVQDTFLALWRDRGRMESIENLKGFLHTSVKFLALKKLRRIRVEHAYAQYLAGKLPAQQVIAEQESAVLLKELQATIQEGITQLPPQQQRAFRLSREQGLTHEQIGEVMGIGKKTVKDYIVRAIAFLRPYLEHSAGLFIIMLF